MILDAMRTVVGPGGGYVGRWPEIAFLIPENATTSETFIGLVGGFTQAPGHPQPDPAAFIENATVMAGNDPATTFAVVVWHDGALHAIVSGDARVDVGTTSVTASSSPNAITDFDDSDPVLLRGADDAHPATSVGTNLRLGVVPGSTLLLVADEVAPPPPPPEPPTLPPAALAEEEAPSVQLASFETADLTTLEARTPLPVLSAADGASGESGGSDGAEGADASDEPGEAGAGDEPGTGPAETTIQVLPADEDAPPAVEVRGIRCSRQHFNNPLASYCQVCGISMVHATHHLVGGVRPTLGFLVFDDGNTYALDRNYLIGREPDMDRDEHTALILDDEEGGVSRNHAEVTLHEWDVVIHDLGSTNGLFIWDANNRAWQAVPQGNMHRLSPGDFVSIGRRSFVYESVLRR